MVYVVVAIIAVAGLALLISSGAGDLFGLSESQFGAAVPLVALLAVFLGGAVARNRNIPKTLGNAAIWVGI